jgi:hypothetical protein
MGGVLLAYRGVVNRSDEDRFARLDKAVSTFYLSIKMLTYGVCYALAFGICGKLCWLAPSRGRRCREYLLNDNRHDAC